MIKKIKNDNAITLVVLVITIVVILILSAVTLSTLNGENGLIIQTKREKEEIENKQSEMEDSIGNLENQLSTPKVVVEGE